MQKSLKKPSGHVGTRTCVAGISSQQTCYIPLDIILYNYLILVYLPVKITGSNIVVFCMLTLYFR